MLELVDKIINPARRADIAPFIAMDVKRESTLLEQAGRKIIHMEVGEPSAPPPRLVREAAIAALGGQSVGYTDALGLFSLRQRIARHYAETYGVSVDPQRVAITTGSSGGFVMAFLALFDPGARVAVSAPGYPAYRNIFKALGVETVEVRVDARNRFAMTAAALEAAHAAQKLDGVLVMSPANPTGAMQDEDSLRDIADFCAAHGVKFISDEIYHGLTYERPAQTALAFSDRAIVVNSFSKYYCMTGWRVGWLVLPPELVRTRGAPAAVARHFARRPCRRSPPKRLSMRGKSWRRSRRAIAAIATFCSTACRNWGFPISRRPTAPFTSMPTSAAFRAIRRPFAMTCCIAPDWPPRRAKISIRRRGICRCACPTPAPRPT